MEENNQNNVQEKIYGLNIASLVLGIIAIVFWCLWFISIPCAILAIIFGIIGVKKAGKGMAIAGIITASIAMAIYLLIFAIAFVYGFVDGFTEGLTNTNDSSYYSSPYYY